MTDEGSEFDEAAGHRFFAAAAFNRTWDLIENPDRTDEDTAEMIHMTHASRWHWGHRDDATAVNLTIAAWQLSRVYAIAGIGEEASRYAGEAMEIATAHELPPFHVGYAHEAMARAAALRGDQEARDHHLAAARDLAARIDEVDHRDALLADLDSLGA